MAEKILVIQTGFIGDVILSTPVLSELHARFPQAAITLLTTPVAAGLFRAHPLLSEVWTYDKRASESGLRGIWRMARRIQQGGFTQLFCLHKSVRSSLVSYLSKIPKRYGFRAASMPFLYSQTSTRKQYAHEVQRNLAILKPLGLDPAQSRSPMTLGFDQETLSEADSRLNTMPMPLIGLAPGSVWPTKRWTAEGFADVARFYRKQGYGVVLIGGPDDRAAAKEILTLVGSDSGILDLVGACSLVVSAAVISKLNVLVSNDSAPLHIASATKVPAVAVFCATVPEFGFTPWEIPSRVLGVSGLACRPCGSHGGIHCPTGTHACQLKLSSDSVVAAVGELLDEQHARAGE